MAVLILSGHHLGFLPQHFAEPYLSRGLIAPLGGTELRYDVTFQMVTRNRRQHSDITRALVEDLRAVQLCEASAEVTDSASPPAL